MTKEEIDILKVIANGIDDLQKSMGKMVKKSSQMSDAQLIGGVMVADSISLDELDGIVSVLKKLKSLGYKRIDL